MEAVERKTAGLFADPAVTIKHQDDGIIILSNPKPLEPYARCIGDYLEHWAAQKPDSHFLAERNSQGGWRYLSYAQALQQVKQIATFLLAQGLTTETPVCVLSDNSIEHALLMLACLHIGIPYSAISPAYSLVSKDYGKLKDLIQRLQPGLIYASPIEQYVLSLKSISNLHRARIIVSQSDQTLADKYRFNDLLSPVNSAAVDAANSAIGPDTVAKILFTSGSTGSPKGVINTQRMLCSSQQAKKQLWPFLIDQPPVLVDWLPWNHTFGGNHNFNMVLANGGTLYLDGGKPVPKLFDTSIDNLRSVAPTLYMQVPRAFDMLLPVLKKDAAFRKHFFSELRLIFYAAASLPQHLWDGLIELSKQELGYAIPMVTAWGSTETSPLATDCHYQAPHPGVIGLPIPGVSIKLVPNSGKLEVRVKGPNVTPGYFKQADITQEAFDEQGYYRIGDAARFANPDKPEKGLMFDGRVSEDFKLTTATWVSTGTLRVKGIEALTPVAQDIVVTGHDKDSVGFLVFLNANACAEIAELDADTNLEKLAQHPTIKNHVKKGLQKLERNNTGSSTYADRRSE